MTIDGVEPITVCAMPADDLVVEGEVMENQAAVKAAAPRELHRQLLRVSSPEWCWALSGDRRSARMTDIVTNPPGVDALRRRHARSRARRDALLVLDLL